MARFDIISKDGGIVRYSGKPRYIGSYLKPSYLEFSEISTPNLISWEVGDYVDYPRTGMRYRLYSIPQPSKNARKDSHGRAFTYSNVQLYAATKELEIALFRDLVANDNGIHFSTSPDVSTYENVEGIARRIQACMDDMYPDRWIIRVAEFDAVEDAEIIEKISAAKDFALSGGTCLDALSKIYELWQDVGWFHSYENGKEVITIGYSNKKIDENTTEPYLYGKGNGLTAIKKNQTNKDEFATRLCVYGSERNLPSRYYNDKDILNAESVDIRNLMLPLDSWGVTDGLPDARKAYLENAEAIAKFGLIPKVHFFDSSDSGTDIYPSIEGMTVGDIRKVLGDIGQTKYVPSVSVYPDDSERVDVIRTAVNPLDNGVIRKGGNEYKSALVESLSERKITVNAVPGLTIPLLLRYPYFNVLVPADYARGDVMVSPTTSIRIPDANFKSVVVTFTICDYEDPDDAAIRKDATIIAEKNEDGIWVATPPQKIRVEYDGHYDGGFPIYCFVTIEATRESASESKSIEISFDAGESFIGINEILDKTFHITLKQIGFDINYQASLGKGKTISIKTGDCAGRDFIVDSCFYYPDNDFWALDLRRQKDDTLGMMFPNSVYQIKEGDEFVLIDIAMPEVYVRAASERLLSEGEKLLARASKIQNHYEPSIDAKVMMESGRTLREGMFMEITDEDVIDDTTDHILIDTLSIYEDESAIPTYKVTLRERRKVTYKGTPSATSATKTSSVETEESGDDLSNYATKSYVDKIIGPINGMFYFADDNTIGTKYNFFSEQQVGAGGIGEPETGGSSGGGIIDTEMSDTSDNAVANRVIKEYVDNETAELDERITAIEEGGASVKIEVDTEMSATSENAVQNKVIKAYIDDADVHLEGYIEEQVNGLEESVDRKISDVETTIEQLDKAIDDQIDALASDIKVNPETYLPLKTINGQSLYGAGDILISGGGGSVTETKYNLRFSAYSSQTLYVSRGEKAEVKFSFISQVMYVGTSAFVDTGEAGIVTISVKRPSDSSYQPVKTMTVPSNAVQTVDIADYLGDGTNLVRISGEGETTGKTAENLAFTVIRSSLSIQTNFEWWKPQTADTITMPYYVGGTIDKTLHLTVTGPNGYSKSYSKALGTTPYLESVASIVIDHPGASGVYTLSAYVASTDGNFRTSELAVQTIFVTAGAAGTYMAVNNISKLATNYTENTFFDYAVYNKGLASAAINFDIKKDSNSVYATSLSSVTTGAKQTFSAPLEISTSDSNDFSVSVSATSNGVSLITPVSIQVDNSYSFAAFPGAVFVMNPKTRDNSQSNRNYIINEVDGSLIAATWSGMNWGSDGYQTVNGVKVLRIFAGSSVSINYQPFKSEAARSGKTLILDILLDNVVDYEDAVMSIVKNLAASWLGVKITPEKMTVFSSLMGDEETQSFKFEDRTRLRLSLVVMPDAYGNSGFNLVAMYVNGTKNREFTYANTDSFANDGNIVIGSDSADIDTYAIMVYDEALSSEAIHQNHVNLLDTIEEKKAFRDKNDVLAANGVDIDIEKVKKLCNVVVFEGELPSLSNPNKFKNNWYIYWRDNPEWNAVIRNIQQDGQGTSAKLYYEWNQRGKTNENTVTTYADGSTTTGAFIFIPGKPKIKTFTWKLNWASMPQCNKMGSVNSINDLCTALSILDNDGNPTAIYQRPFVGFQLTYDDSGNPIYTFVGLFTGGPDKGDPNWFNYDYEKYPDLISVEGADNASAGALFKVPWNPSAGRWQFNMDEESMQYNGINAFDYNAGNYETKADIQAHYERVWKPVYDFVYQCSPNIAHFDGTLAQLNAQASALKDNDLEYWLDGGGLYYYESSLGQYIPSDSGSGQMNLYDQLVDKGYGVTSAMLSGLTADEVNIYLKVARTMKFKFEADRYFHLAQGRFAVNWNLVLGSTDTRTKNTYWVVRGLLSEGYRCTLFWDDTDTIGPFTNQGQDRKPYWAEVGDKYADGSPVWNGEQNRFYNLMELAFPDELADDMRSLLNAMVELGGMTTGNKSDQLFAFFHKYYFSQAQEYFPSALYNAAAKRLYERAKLVYGISYNNDTDPITQMLGDYYSGWKRWIKRRIQYIQSKYHWGDYSGASGDVISVRAAGQSIDYQITPAIWMYPVIMNGTSPVRGERTEAGQACNMTVDLGGSADQQNTIKGVHYLQDIGYWHDKRVHGAMSVYGRMLRELHIGHPTEDIVITITSLTLGETPSLRLIDLRRVSTLAGILDLSSCTHLQTLYAQGTSLTSVTFPFGGPLASVGFPATMQQILLRNFPKLYNSGVDISECKTGVTDFMITECPNMKPLTLLSAVIAAQESQGAAHALMGVRVTGINETYSSSEILAQIAALTDGTYQGLDSAGVRDGGHAILEGKVSINANAYQDEIEAIEDYFQGRLALTITGQYFLRFADLAVIAVLNDNGVGSDGGVTKEQAEAVTTIGTWFKNNMEITSFDELKYFTNVTTLVGSAFSLCTNLQSIDVSNVEVFNSSSFDSCTGLTALNMAAATDVDNFVCQKCTNLRIVDIGENLVYIGAQTFYNCSSLTAMIIRAVTPPTLYRTNAFTNTNNCPIYVPNRSVESYKAATNWNNAGIVERIHGLWEIEGVHVVKFNNTAVDLEYIATENDALEMVFEDTAYKSDMHYFGNPSSSDKGYTMSSYNNRYHFGALATEKYGGTWAAGVKTIKYNVGEGNNVYIDDTLIGSYTSIGALFNNNLHIGLRGDDASANLDGYLYSFRMYNKTTGEDIIRLKPTIQDGVIVLYDEVRNIYLTNTIGNPLTAG